MIGVPSSSVTVTTREPGVVTVPYWRPRCGGDETAWAVPLVEYVTDMPAICRNCPPSTGGRRSAALEDQLQLGRA